MRTASSIFICLFIASAVAICQEDEGFNALIKLRPLRILIDEIPISYEVRYKDHCTLEFEAGAIYSNPIINNYVDGTVFFFYKGFLNGIRHKWFPINKTYYFGLGLKYTEVFTDSKSTIFVNSVHGLVGFVDTNEALWTFDRFRN